ncbi:hypothetical protein C9J85_12210 [Haloferax sp. wsp5]|nr:hypothetical protein C9J85_12210 [Haloferax sp. wsp5]
MPYSTKSCKKSSDVGHSEYQTVSSEEKQLRGRLDVQRQLQRQGPVPTKFECTYASVFARRRTT